MVVGYCILSDYFKDDSKSSKPHHAEINKIVNSHCFKNLFGKNVTFLIPPSEVVKKLVEMNNNSDIPTQDIYDIIKRYIIQGGYNSYELLKGLKMNKGHQNLFFEINGDVKETRDSGKPFAKVELVSTMKSKYIKKSDDGKMIPILGLFQIVSGDIPPNLTVEPKKTPFNAKSATRANFFGGSESLTKRQEFYNKIKDNRKEQKKVVLGLLLYLLGKAKEGNQDALNSLLKAYSMFTFDMLLHSLMMIQPFASPDSEKMISDSLFKEWNGATMEDAESADILKILDNIEATLSESDSRFSNYKKFEEDVKKSLESYLRTSDDSTVYEIDIMEKKGNDISSGLGTLFFKVANLKAKRDVIDNDRQFNQTVQGGYSKRSYYMGNSSMSGGCVDPTAMVAGFMAGGYMPGDVDGPYEKNSKKKYFKNKKSDSDDYIKGVYMSL